MCGLDELNRCCLEITLQELERLSIQACTQHGGYLQKKHYMNVIEYRYNVSKIIGCKCAIVYVCDSHPARAGSGQFV